VNDKVIGKAPQGKSLEIAGASPPGHCPQRHQILLEQIEGSLQRLREL